MPISQLLVARVAQPDLASLPDWQVAAILNAPDPSATPIIEWAQTQIGIGSVLATLGATAGANLLSQIEAASATNAVLKWGLEILRSGNFDLSLQVTRDTIEGLMQAGMITAAQRDAFFALSRRDRRPSWAEFNQVKVDAREVGLARGGK